MRPALGLQPWNEPVPGLDTWVVMGQKTKPAASLVHERGMRGLGLDQDLVRERGVREAWVWIRIWSVNEERGRPPSAAPPNYHAPGKPQRRAHCSGTLFSRGHSAFRSPETKPTLLQPLLPLLQLPGSMQLGELG